MTSSGVFMTAKACPLCGLVTDVPHETHQGCIDALQDEIARVREILGISRPTNSPLPESEADEHR